MRGNKRVQYARWCDRICARVRVRSSSSHQFVGDAAQSKLVTFLADNALKLLWCHVCRCPRFIHYFCLLKKDRNAKVRKDSLSLSIEENVGRFEISMDHAFFMRVVQSLSNVGKDCYCLFYWRRVGIMTTEEGCDR